MPFEGVIYPSILAHLILVTNYMTHLRGNVIRSTTERSRRLRRYNMFFTHTEVCNFNVTILIQHDII